VRWRRKRVATTARRTPKRVAIACGEPIWRA
jgi:hypothetical protein